MNDEVNAALAQFIKDNLKIKISIEPEEYRPSQKRITVKLIMREEGSIVETVVDEDWEFLELDDDF